MSGFEHFADETRAIETELARKGIALRLDWDDEVAVRALAREAVQHARSEARHVAGALAAGQVDYQELARVELFGLAAVMLKTLQESAEEGFLSHGGPIWKTFARALWAESGQAAPDSTPAEPVA